VAIFVALSVAGALTYFNNRLGQVQRVEFGRDVLSEEADAGEPQNYLIVGSDSDEGLDPNDPVTKGRGSVGNIRSDSIMILRVDPAESKARLLSFPRDLWVDIAGIGQKNRINSAVQHGPDTLPLTIQQNFGIEIHHYLEVNFHGFKELVKAVDGVPMYFPEKVRDIGEGGHGSGLKINAPGCYTLDPGSALALARSRHYQVFRDGRWRPDPEGDLGRIKRQQFFIEQVLHRAVAKGARNPGTLRRLIDVGVMNVKLDSTLSAGDLLGLGRRFKDFNPEDLEKFSLPVDDRRVGDAQVLDLRVAEAQPTLDLFRGVEPGTVTPASVRVQVLNGTEKKGVATEATDALVAAGFTAEDPTDADPLAATIVRFAPGKTVEAQLVGRYLAGPTLFEEVPEQAVDIIVVAGANFRGVRTSPKPKSEVQEPDGSAPTTTTTAPPSDASLPDFVPDVPPEGMECP
jgi:LCP family protein required for cell wall assembly